MDTLPAEPALSRTDGILDAEWPADALADALADVLADTLADALMADASG